ncbi:lipase [Gordonia otitidis]|uniref:lipase family protein n=1 Tax=Gordonia otitidis TaxID=249058 RepID=UPI001D144D0B|nr:lipase family protein [Gordonia otitidis]UEA59104.1 lipase [Gordonia otitidis]
MSSQARIPRRRVAATLGAGVSMLLALVVGLALTVTSAPAAAAPSTAGTVLTAEDITDRPDAKVAGAGKVIAVTYLSAQSDGRLVPVRATIMIPAVTAPAGGYRVLAYGHGTAGLGDDCTVTDRMGHQGRYDDWLGPWLKKGYVIAATEYAGIGGPGVHAYLDGDVAGKNIIDSVRAARVVTPRYTNSEVSRGFLSSGGSQGAHASLWAGHLAPSYAPELTNVGVAATSPPVDIADYFSVIRPGVPPVEVPDYVTYFSYVLAGLKVARPDVDVDSYLTPQGRKVVEDAQTLCYPNQGRATKGMSVGQLVARPFNEGPLIPALRSVTSVPEKGYPAPILVQQGTLDPVAFAPLTQQWVDRARGNGVTVDLRTYQAGHGVGVYAETNALAWSQGLNWPKG